MCTSMQDNDVGELELTACLPYRADRGWLVAEKEVRNADKNQCLQWKLQDWGRRGPNDQESKASGSPVVPSWLPGRQSGAQSYNCKPPRAAKRTCPGAYLPLVDPPDESQHAAFSLVITWAGNAADWQNWELVMGAVWHGRVCDQKLKDTDLAYIFDYTDI